VALSEDDGRLDHQREIDAEVTATAEAMDAATDQARRRGG